MFINYKKLAVKALRKITSNRSTGICKIINSYALYLSSKLEYLSYSPQKLLFYVRPSVVNRLGFPMPDQVLYSIDDFPMPMLRAD